MSRPVAEEPIVPPQTGSGYVPETIIIEANRTISELNNPGLNSDAHEWETPLSEVLQIRRGDEIRVSNVFLNQIGADSSVITFNDASTDLQNNKARIVYSFYGCDDGTNNKRKVIDMLGKASGNVGFTKEFNTYNDIPLYRFQNNGLELTYADLTNATKGQFLGTGAEEKGLINYLNFWNDEPTYTEHIIAPYEDRYLPGVFYNNIFLRTQNATSSLLAFFRISLDLANNELVVQNNTGTGDLCSFIQPGMIVNLTTDSPSLGSTNNQFLDNYYFVKSANPSAVHNDNKIGLDYTNQLNRQSSRYINIIPTEPGHTATPVVSPTPQTIKFDANPLFNTQIKIGTYLTDNINGASTLFGADTKITAITGGTPSPHNFFTIYGLGELGQPSFRVFDLTSGGAITSPLEYFGDDTTIFGTDSRVISVVPDPTLNFPTLVPLTAATIGSFSMDFVNNHNENYKYYVVSDNTPDTSLYTRADFTATDTNLLLGTDTTKTAVNVRLSYATARTNYLYLEDTTNTSTHKYLITNQTPDDTAFYNNLPFVSSTIAKPTNTLLLSPNGFVNNVQMTIEDINGSSGIKELFTDSAGQPVYNIEHMTITLSSGSGTIPVDTQVYNCQKSTGSGGNTLFTLHFDKVISGATPSTIFNFTNNYGANSGYVIFNRDLHLSGSLDVLTFTTEDGQFDAGYESIGMTLFDSGKTTFQPISAITWNKANRYYELSTSVALGITGSVSPTQTELKLQSNAFGIDGSGNKNNTNIENQVDTTTTSTITFRVALTQNVSAPNNKIKIVASKPGANSGTITMSKNILTNITLSSTIVLNEIETLLTISPVLLADVPPSTPVYFTPFPSNGNTPLPLTYHIRLAPQGYNYTNVNAGEYSMYGYTDDIRPKKGDRYSQYAYNRLDTTTTLETNIKQINTTGGQTIIPSIELSDPITSLSATGGYNENSLVVVGSRKVIQFLDNGDGTADLTIDMSDVANFNVNGTGGIMSETNPSTNTIFNMQRGVAFKFTNITDATQVEYFRIPNGVNDSIWTDATAIYSSITTHYLQLTKVQRRYFESGVNNTGEYDPATAIDWLSIVNANPENVKVEIIDIIHSYSEWNGKTNSSVNTLSVNGNTFNASYRYGQSFIMIKDNIQENLFINSTAEQEKLAHGTTSSFSPLDIIGFGQANYFYTGGHSRNFATSYYQGTDPRDKGEFVLHREYIDIDLTAGGTNLSPSDIANIITEQTHTLRPAKINISVDSMLNGFDYPFSEGFGLPTNRFIIPIVSNSYSESTTPGAGDPVIDGITFDGSPSSIDGCFRFHNTYFNYKLVDQIKTPSGGQPGFNLTGTITAGTNINNTMLPIYPRTTNSFAITGNCFAVGTQSLENYPIMLIGNKTDYGVGFAQYCGTNNATMGFSANFNRLALSYLHQPYISASIDKGDKGFIGGVQACRYFYPYKTRQFDETKPIGKPFWDRFGGVNIECYAGNFIDSGGTYFDSIDTTDSSLVENYTTTDPTLLNQIGRRFWNKLGFSDKQLTENIGHTFSESATSGYIVMKGTTGQSIDSASGYVSDVPTATSFQSQTDYPGLPTGATPNKPQDGGSDWTSQTSIGGLTGLANKVSTASTPTYIAGFRSSAHTGYNAPPTSGEPLVFDNSNSTGNQDNLKFSKLDGTQPLKGDAIDPTGASLIGQFGFTIATESALIKADNLPIKTINSYYLLFCKELGGSNNFYTTSNRGNINPEAMAIISSLNTQSDFYFSYQSPISFFAKSDFLLSRITTRVLNADLSVPTTLGKNSSVIYQIIRFNPKPPTIQPTISQQQSAFFQTMEELDKQQAANLKASGSNVGQIIDAITEAALTPADDQSDLISSIIERAQRMGILNVSPAERRRILENDPEGNDLLTEIEELQTARQGVFTGALAQITDPLGIEDDPQQQPGGVVIDPEPMDDTLNNQIIQEAFDRRLQERSEFRAGTENVRERISRLGDIAESPLLQEYTGGEQRITLGGMRRGIEKEADPRRRRIQFEVDPSERIPEDIELRIDTQGNIRRAQARARGRVIREQQRQDRRRQEQQRELEEDRAVMRDAPRQRPRRYNPRSRNPEEREQPITEQRVRINPELVRTQRAEEQRREVARQQSPEPEETGGATREI